MIFTNITAFENRMNDENITIAFFSIAYGNCTIECVYAKVLKKFLFAIVDKNVGFTCSLNGEYASAFINHQEAVAALANCRNAGWDPIHFYEALNNSLPTVNFTQVTTAQYGNTTTYAVSNFEDRIFFHNWRRSNISDKQIKKTEELLGHEIVVFCKNTGVTPVYYDHPTDRTMNVAVNFIEDYNTHNTEDENN